MHSTVLIARDFGISLRRMQGGSYTPTTNAPTQQPQHFFMFCLEWTAGEKKRLPTSIGSSSSSSSNSNGKAPSPKTERHAANHHTTSGFEEKPQYRPQMVRGELYRPLPRVSMTCDLRLGTFIVVHISYIPRTQPRTPTRHLQLIART